MPQITFSFSLLTIAAVAVGCAAAPRRETVIELPAVVPQPQVAAPAPKDPSPAIGVTPKPILPTELSFVTHVEGRTVVVIDTEAQDAWLSSLPVLLQPRQTNIELHAPIKLSALPATHRLEGRAFAFYERDKVVCTASLGALSVEGELEEPGMDWAGSPQRTPKATDREVADEAWGYASKWLIAEVKLPPECKNATWARAASLPAPTFPEAVGVSDDTIQDAKQRLEALDSYAEAQRGFEQSIASAAPTGQSATSSGKPELWGNSPSATHFLRTYTWRGEHYVAVGEDVFETCAFSASVFARFKINGRSLEAIGTRTTVPGDGMLVDLNGDGLLEIVSGASGNGEQRLEPFDDAEGPSFSLAIASPGCPC